MLLTTPLTLLAAAAAATPVAGGPLAYAACQTGKNVWSKSPDVIWSLPHPWHYVPLGNFLVLTRTFLKAVTA
jgi:hypothetical protein